MEKQELDTSWFDLKNYKELEYFDLEDWHRQLIIRVFSVYDGELDIQRIKEKPIYGLFDNSDYLTNSILNFYVKSVSHSFDTKSVKSAIVKDIDDRFKNNWGKDFLDYRKKIATINEYVNNPKFFIEKHGEIDKFLFIHTLKEMDMLDTLLDSEKYSSKPLVSVNLKATNEQIISDFTHWLTEYRKIAGYPPVQKKDSTKPLKEFGCKEFKQWIDHRVLPYIDLMLVEAHEGKFLKEETLANLIFPDMDYILQSKDKLKNTVKPIANWLLSESTLKAMELQLASS